MKKSTGLLDFRRELASFPCDTTKMSRSNVLQTLLPDLIIPDDITTTLPGVISPKQMCLDKHLRIIACLYMQLIAIAWNTYLYLKT